MSLSRPSPRSFLLPLLAAGLTGATAGTGVAQTPRSQPTGTAAAPAPSAADIERARRVLTTTPLIDGHNDLPWAIRESSRAPHDVEAYDLRKPTPGHTDLARLAKGMVGAQFWSVY